MSLVLQFLHQIGQSAYIRASALEGIRRTGDVGRTGFVVSFVKRLAETIWMSVAYLGHVQALAVVGTCKFTRRTG